MNQTTMQKAKEVKEADIERWAVDETAVSVLIREDLVGTGGDGWPVKPPTYAKEEGQKGGRYQIDELPGGGNVCLIDSVQSSNNRREPIFLHPPYRELVPDLGVKFPDGQEKSILELPHRAADVSARFSEGSGELTKAFEAYESGDAWPMATLAPTSLVFGAWDSRNTGVKIPRIVGGLVLAFDVSPLGAPFQYFPARKFGEMLAGEEGKSPKGARSEEGFAEALGPGLGGVIVRGGIRMQVEVNLRALRALGAKSGKELDAEKTARLRKYILLLALIAATAPISYWLRQGCNLKRLSSSAHLVHAVGEDEPISFPASEVLADWAKGSLPGPLPEKKRWEFGVALAKTAVKQREKGKPGKPSSGAAGTNENDLQLEQGNE